MKYALTALICLFLTGATPALSAPQSAYDYCWAKAAPIRFNGRGEREAFMARCIADLTPAPSAKRNRSKKSR
jgi:hypothetical protein